MKGLLSDINTRYDEDRSYFSCKTEQMSNLVNKAFWILDFAKGAKTKYGDGRYVVKVTGRKEDDPSLNRKFLTNATRLKYSLDALREKNALPYRVILRYANKQYTFEDCGEGDVDIAQ